MAKNFVQCGDTMTGIAPSGGCVSGGLYKIGALIGVCIVSVAEGAEVELKTTGVWDLAKTSAQAWTAGDAIYMIPGTRLLTNVAGTGNFLVGYAPIAAANPSATGRVRLNGTLGLAATA